MEESVNKSSKDSLSMVQGWDKRREEERRVHVGNIFLARGFLSVCPILLNCGLLTNPKVQKADLGSISIFASRKQENFSLLLLLPQLQRYFAFLLSATQECAFPELEYHSVRWQKCRNLEVIWGESSMTVGIVVGFIHSVSTTVPGTQ